MGVYKYDDPETGIGYDLNIVGDTPTNEEFARLAAKLQTDRANFATEYEETFGEYEEPDDGTAIGRGFARGKKQIKQAFGETLGTIGEKSGLEFLAEYGQGLEGRAQQELGELMLEQPERMQSTDVDSIGSAFRYAGEIVGEQIPQLGLGLGAAIAAPIVAPAAATATALGSFAVGAGAAAVATAPILFGNNIQRQEDEVAAGKKASVDVSDALVATFGQAALEGIADKVLLGGAFRSLGKSIFTRAATRAGSGATTESLTEVGQQMMERAQAGLPIDSEDAIAEYREAAIAGGLVGGGTRATLGAFGERSPEIDDTTPGPEGQVGQDTQTTPQLQEGQEQGELFAVEPTEDAASAARAAIATDARLTDPNVDEDFIREELDQDYSPAVIEQIIAERRLAANAAQEKEAQNAKAAQDIDFDLFDTMEGAKEANAALNVALNKAIQMNNYETARKYMAEVQKKYADFGAIDTEPREIILNKLNSAFPRGKAQQTDEQRAAESAVVAGETAAPSAAVVKEEANLVNEQTRKQKKADAKAVAKTQDYLPGLEPQESGAAAIESEQTGQKIEVKPKDATTARVVQVLQKAKEQQLSGSAKLVSKTGIKSLYDAGLVDEGALVNPIAANLEATRLLRLGPDEVLAQVNANKKRTRTEEAFTPDYVKNVLGVTRPAAPLLKAATEGNLSGKSLDDPAVVKRLANYVGNRGAESNAVVASMEGRGFKYDGANKQFIRPEPEAVGTSIPDSRPSVAGTGRAGSGVESAVQPTPPESRPVGTDMPTTVPPVVATREQPDTLEVSPEPEATPDEQGIAAVQQLAEQATATPVQVTPQTEATPAMQQAATPGQVTGVAQQNIPAPVQVPDAPQVQAAPVPQEQLQAMEAQQDAAAQARIEQVFDSNRGKQPQVREYHDTQVDPQSAPEVTTAVDKEGVAELLETSDKELNPQAKAAKLFFKRFRRPVDALAEMGAVSVAGPTQNIEKDYTPVEFAFYKGMTQKAAMDARKWVFDNLSRQAFVETRNASVTARRDTSKFNPSDAYISVTKAARQIKSSEQRAYQRQYEKDAAAYAEAKRAEATAEQLNKRLAPDSSIDAPRPMVTKAGEELYRVTTPIKGETAFDAYLLSMGFKKRKVPKQDDYVFIDPDTKEALTDAEIMDFYDGWIASRDMGFLLIDPVHGLDQALLPSIKNALQRGDLQFALDAIASTSQVKRIREIAAKLGSVVGGTQVQVVDDISSLAGRKAAGLFSPEQNTIYIDANNGMNVHTILHEMTHAATSASIAANPSLPEVKQLQTILKNIREQFGEIYGTANLDEFVAEAFSNPEFQSALALSKVDGGKMSGWEKFTGAIKRIFRRLGLSPSPTALSEVDRLVEGLLSPSPDTRAAPNMLMAADNKKGAAGLVQNIANVVPESGKEKIAELSSVVFDEGVGRTAKSWTLNTLPVNILTDIASKRIPFAKQLNMLINKQSGALRQKSEVLDSILNNLHAWQRKNKDLAKVLNNIIPRSTFLKVDPSRSDAKYMKTIRDDKERSAEYDQLKAEYDKLDNEGKAFYRQMRNYFQDTYDDIISALDARLEATIPDAEVKKNAFEQLRQLLQQDTGVIRPYFPLQRKGNYRLVYTAPDPDNGRPELFVEYYPTLRKAEQSRAKIIEVDAEAAITDSNSVMDFRKAPNTGFVRDILNTLQFNEDKFNSDENYRKVMQEIVDLSLDAMPERSFMQNFRRRKGVRGFIGDTTPTGMGAMDFDAYTMLKEKGRDLNRQLVQLRSAAEIEKFRSQLEPYKQDPSTAMMAQKLDQIASFAQSPNVPRVSQVVNSLGFGMTMGLNFSSAAITFFDVAMSAMPILAGKHKLGPTSRAFGTATKLFAGAPSKRTVMATGPDGELVPQEVNMGTAGKSISNYDLSNLPEMLRNIRADILIKMGIDQGQFNQSMTQENLEIGRDAPLETFNKYSSFMFHHSERFNRETTLTAAYMLEVNKMQREKGKLTDADYEKAAQEAIDTTEFTLGATAAAGRPIIAQKGIGNILFLFKRFAISKYYMMAKLAQESAAGDKVAQAATRNFLISTGMFAGLGGMPLMGGIGAMYNLFADDDEDDFETATRKLVGEGVYGGLANEMLGVDLANRISMNSLLYRAPLIDKDQSNLWTLIEQLGGPVIGVGLSIERGMKDIYQGEVQRGIEAMAPAAVRNGLKSVRFATEGAETRRGDPITEDINPYNVVMQGLGFAPQAYIQQLEANKNVRRREDAVNSRRTKLLRRRNMAIREGDRDELEKVERLIEEYNAGLPQDADVRKKLITSDAKQSSLRTFNRTTSNMRGGITTTDFSKSVLEQYDF